MQGIYVTQQIHYIIPAPVLLILGWIFFFLKEKLIYVVTCTPITTLQILTKEMMMG